MFLSPHDTNSTKRSTFLEHLDELQARYDFVCGQRETARQKADSLHKSSERARRTYVSTLQRYHENDRDYRLRNEQAQYLCTLKEKLETEMREAIGDPVEGGTGEIGRSPSKEHQPDQFDFNEPLGLGGAWRGGLQLARLGGPARSPTRMNTEEDQPEEKY